MEVNNENAKINNQINIENNYAPINLNGEKTTENTENITINKVALKEMIGKGELKEVLDILIKTFPKKNEFLLQKGRLKSITNESQIDIVSRSDFGMEKNKISYAVLSMIDDL